jgi:uncharacterized protein YjlB
MTAFETIKKSAERLTGWRRPSPKQLGELVRQRTPLAIKFNDDGNTPNHPHWPVLIYRSAVLLPRSLDPAAVFEDLLAQQGWGRSWRGEIYDYLHYHSRIHEVLGIARGSAKVRLGGKKGRTLTLKAGDLAILSAGTGHQALSLSKTFLASGRISSHRYL